MELAESGITGTTKPRIPLCFMRATCLLAESGMIGATKPRILRPRIQTLNEVKYGCELMKEGGRFHPGM
jgi:hypothetical protein